MEDFEYVDQILKNNREGAKVFLDEYFDTIQKAIKSVNIKDCTLTENDLTHEVFVYFLDNDKKVLRRWKGAGSLAGYIYLISKRHAIKIVEKEVKAHCNKFFFDPDTLPSKIIDETEITNNQEKELLTNVIKKLPKESKKFLKALYWLQLDTDKLMELFEISRRDLLYKKKYRLIKKMRKLIEKFKRRKK